MPSYVDRRRALSALAGFFAASPLVKAQDSTRRPRLPANYYDDPLYECVRVMDFAEKAKAKLDPIAWDYLEQGSEDESSLRDNRAGFQKLILRPRALVDVHQVDLSLELFGQKLDFPILFDPAGGKNCFFPDGEMVVARGAKASKTLHITNGGVHKMPVAERPQWWQLNTGGAIESTQMIKDFIKPLEDEGCGAICLTIDIMYVSHRDRNIRNRFERNWCEVGIPPRDAHGKLPRALSPETVALYPSRRTPSPTWENLAELCSLTKLPVVVKGILTAEDTERCVKAGAKGVIVSNHGARQLDEVGGTIEALPECVAAARGRIPVLIDGGLRRGTDVLKALALGATAVCVARPYLYGLAAFVQRGVERVIELMRTELALDMGLAGVPNLAAIDKSLVRIRGGSF
ncbi:MAG: alpha-hydroxy acid oxidase [Acidobacteria bacterium]|nr:alpha-hydroxy acid oxidase [Acidobacteriota bacterium]